jgi:hypothetical protein
MWIHFNFIVMPKNILVWPNRILYTTLCIFSWTCQKHIFIVYVFALHMASILWMFFVMEIKNVCTCIPLHPMIAFLIYNTILHEFSFFYMTAKFLRMVIGTDCTGSCKSNYHTITTTMVPQYFSMRVHQKIDILFVIWN